MSLFSLEGKTNKAKLLAFVFVVGLFSLAFFVFNSQAAVGTLSSPTTTVTSTFHILFSFSTSTNDSSQTFSFSSSTDGITFSASTTVSTSTGRSFNFGNLATNTLYFLRVAEGDASNSSTYATTSIFTLAASAGTPTVGTPTASTIPITIDPATNPTNTTFAIFNTSTSNFLAADGSSTATPVWQTTSTWGTSFAATGLTANTSYQFVVIARNGNSITAATSSASTATTTLASTPSSLSVSAGANGFTFTWSGDSTLYYAEDVTGATNSGLISGTSYSVGGINCGTTHSFRVKGQSSAGVDTSFTSTIDGTTSACGTGIIVGGGSGNGGGSSNSSASVTVPSANEVSPGFPYNAAASVSLPETASPVAVFVHTLRPGSRGGEVKLLQQKLRELGYFKYSTNTGSFGSVTRAAVVAFQKAMGLKPYPGWVGPGTRAALNNL